MTFTVTGTVNRIGLDGDYAIKLETLDAVGQAIWWGCIETKRWASKDLPLELGQKVTVTITVAEGQS